MNELERSRRGFGQRVRQYRQQRGWQLDDLAERIGTTRVSMSRIENGKQNLSFDAMVAIARALEVRLSDLVEDEALGDDRPRQHLLAQELAQRCRQRVQAAVAELSDARQACDALVAVL